ATKKPYGKLLVPVPLVEKIGMSACEMHNVPPASRMIPILSHDSLSALRPRALERIPDARAFLDSACPSVATPPGGGVPMWLPRDNLHAGRPPTRPVHQAKRPRARNLHLVHIRVSS